MSLDGVPLAGVYATDAEFTAGEPTAELVGRVEEVVPTVLAMVDGRVQPRASSGKQVA
jgi:hypothetical protein